MALAATRLIALHKNKGMTVAACLKNRTDYIENPDKTEQGQFVSSYEFPGCNHGSWNPAFNYPDFMSWLFSQKK